MIKQIKIENYKSIPSLNLELGRVNVLIGENGCGKTNVLEAIALGSAAAESKVESELLTLKGIRFSGSEAMKSGFEKETLKQSIVLGFSDDRNEWLHYGIQTGENNEFEIEADLLQDKKEREFEEAIKNRFLHPDARKMIEEGNASVLVDELKDIFPKSFFEKIDKKFYSLIRKQVRADLENFGILDFLLYAPENTHLRRFDEEGQIRPLGIRGEGLFSHLADLARKEPAIFQKINENLQLIDWVEGFEIPNDLIFNERRIQIRDRYLEEGIQYIDQRSSNEGFLYLLFYVTLFVSPYTPKFFAIDNIDNALNPRLCAKLIGELVRLAKEHDKQVIVTAHNPGLLDGLNLNDQEQRLFVISRNKLGHTKALRIEQKPSANGHEPVKLSEQFLRGYIGGIPNI